MNEDRSAYAEEGQWALWLPAILAIFIVLAIVLTKKKKTAAIDKESGYEPEEIYGGMNVLKIDCNTEQMPTDKELPPNTVVECMTNWEWMEREFRKFYKAREDFEKAKATRNFDTIQAAKNQVIEKGWELNRDIAQLDDGDPTWWFIKVDEIIKNLDDECEIAMTGRPAKKVESIFGKPI
jgi:hypothetical protein